MKESVKNFVGYLTEKKCKDVAVYDLSKEGQSYDYVFVATSSSVAANKKLASIVMEDFELEEYPEGYHKGEWIVFDFAEYVIHLFVASHREKYNIDKLWQSKRIVL